MTNAFARASRWTIVILAACTFHQATASGESMDVDAVLGQAIDTYRSALDTEDRDERLELFRRAERLFAAAAEQGRGSADLYANLGNAALQAEHLGNAVLAYRRALLLDPDHERANQNLDHVRELAPDWVPRRKSATFFDSFFFWHRTLSQWERTFGAAASFAVAALLLAVGIALRSNVARNLAILPGVVWCAMLASLAFDPASSARDDAVVTAPEAIARSADSIHSPARFSRPLPTGTEVVVLEERGDWLRVELANGREAWLRASSLTRVAL